MNIYEKADDLMYNHGLLKLLQKYGDVHIVGSYTMGIMTWNDLDFYMDKSKLNTQNYYQLTSDILEKAIPIHFNGELDIKNKSAFLGFETEMSGDRWNIDIWWKDKVEIDDSIVYAHNIIHLIQEKPELKNAIMKIKQDLIIRGFYGFNKGKKHYHSKEIYNAVFNEGILTTEQFLQFQK